MGSDLFASVRTTRNELSNCPNTYRFLELVFSGTPLPDKQPFGRAAIHEMANYPSMQKFLIDSEAATRASLNDVIKEIQAKYPALARLLTQLPV